MSVDKSYEVHFTRPETVIVKEPGYPDNVTRYVVSADGVNSVFYGPNNPNWKARIAAGQDATTSLYGTRYSVPRNRPVEGSWYNSFDPNYSRHGSGYPQLHVVGFRSPSATPLSKASSDAETNFTKDFRRKTQHWSGGVFLGELRETARFLRNPVKGLYELTRGLARNVRSIKTLKRVKPQAYASALSDTWLAYQFAAKPLARDANDAGKALRSLASGRNFDLIKIRGVGEDKEAEVLPWNVDFTGGVLEACETTLEHITKSEVTIRAAWRAGGEIPPTMQFGISKLDIIATAWELIPWSFLVDYFTNMGDVLDALNMRFVEFAWINQSIRNDQIVTLSDWRCPATGPFSGSSQHVRGGALALRTRVVSRNIRDNSFSPRVYTKVPNADSLKWLNIAALASGILASRP